MSAKQTNKKAKTQSTKAASTKKTRKSTPASANKKTVTKAAKEDITLTKVKDDELIASTQSAEQILTLEEKATTPPAKASRVDLAIKDSNTPVIKESKTPAIKETKAPVIKEEHLPAKREAQAPAIKDTQAPMVQGLKPLTETEECIPCAIPDTRTALGANPYLPQIGTVVEIIEETSNIKTFRIVLDDAAAMQALHYGAGQVAQVSVFGVGEATFVISSPPSQKEFLQFSVMRVGELTRALHKLSVGDKVGVRAPLGNAFPCANWQGKDLFFIGGGIGMAPIRSILLHTLENKADYGKISLLYGARTPKDMAYSYELESWLENPDLDCTLTIDIPFGGWDHKVGLIPDILTELAPDPAKTVAIICGPPIMITFTIKALMAMNFSADNIITTLEKRMKCGIGLCGRCNLGNKYVCVDGPVFSWAELEQLPPEL